MSIKRWILGKMNGLTTRADLPRSAPVSPVLRGAAIDDPPSVIRRGLLRTPHDGPAAVPHLGPYAPLIAAIRDELEHFVASYLRLHLAIAERDRYLLTSIDVRAAGPEEEDLLQRFVREFRPEQIKHYFAKEVIGGLPNASAIDLTQFAGLNAGRDDNEDDAGYSELLAELRSAQPGALGRPFEVSLVGRWSEQAPGTASSALPRTPLSGRSVDVALEDASGSRHVKLAAVVPGRRYGIGKGDGCDIVVNGTYASRRHCEIWQDRGTWWVTDAGSTNGVRVERGGSVLGRSLKHPNDAREPAAVEVAAGARIVLSAHAEGSAAEYPRVSVDVGDDARATPVAPRESALVTPATPIAARVHGSALTIAVRTASGSRTVELDPDALPFSIGRSRTQRLVIDWAHEGVSGQHVEITGVDGDGVIVAVHGDNGVTIGDASYPPGSRLTWRPGESMTLGRVVGREPECRLTLTRRA